MPLFTVELNRLADSIGASDLTIWLHTAAPTNANIANGRTSVGGGAYENGLTLASTDISDAADGDITNDEDLDWPQADEAVGTVTHWSAVRGAAGVAFGTLPNTVIDSGDSFRINASTLDLNGATT